LQGFENYGDFFFIIGLDLSPFVGYKTILMLSPPLVKLNLFLESVEGSSDTMIGQVVFKFLLKVEGTLHHRAVNLFLA